MRILVIIPAYNESAAIGRVVSELMSGMDELQINCDYIVVNDGSSDRTEAVLEEQRLNSVTLPANLGIGGAVQTGYIVAKQNHYDIAIQMDGDGQHLPEYIPALIAPILRDEADFVVGSRFRGGVRGGFRSSGARRMGIRLLSHSIRLVTGRRILDVTSGFRAVNRKGILLFSDTYAKDYPEPESIVEALKNGLRVCEVPVEMAPRASGESSINSIKSIYYMIKVTLAILVKGMEKKNKKFLEAVR